MFDSIGHWAIRNSDRSRKNKIFREKRGIGLKAGKCTGSPGHRDVAMTNVSPGTGIYRQHEPHAGLVGASPAAKSFPVPSSWRIFCRSPARCSCLRAQSVLRSRLCWRMHGCLKGCSEHTRALWFPSQWGGPSPQVLGPGQAWRIFQLIQEEHFEMIHGVLDKMSATVHFLPARDQVTAGPRLLEAAVTAYLCVSFLLGIPPVGEPWVVAVGGCPDNLGTQALCPLWRQPWTHIRSPPEGSVLLPPASR